ncbi:MAG: hypothetical protein MZV63_37575 [Marinilabiliales bacterium]|nr:hypothetical protein [Marinilabiliales bacterium]
MREGEGAGIVFTTSFPTTTHPDHRATAAIVEAAAMVASLDPVPVPEKPPEGDTPSLSLLSLTLSDPLGSQLTPPHFFVDVTSAVQHQD